MENKLPEGWEWKKLGEIAEINPKFDKKSVSESTEVTFLPMKCIEELTGNVDTSITKSLEEVSKGYTPLIRFMPSRMSNGPVAQPLTPGWPSKTSTRSLIMSTR